MPKGSRINSITLSDPGAIKALAHPARLAVLEELQSGAELTATECAQIAGLSASAMSYHLRALERWGFVERAPSTGDGRERPWRAMARGWRIEASSGPVAAAATNAVVGAGFERMRTELRTWIDGEATEPTSWQEAAGVINTVAWLTASEARELRRQTEAAVDKIRGRNAHDHPGGARRVRVALVIAPIRGGAGSDGIGGSAEDG